MKVQSVQITGRVRLISFCVLIFTLIMCTSGDLHPLCVLVPHWIIRFYLHKVQH